MRSSGILLHITSLPSPHGVGTLGREAYGFADFLREAGQKYWQILPLGPTGFGDSPYQLFSSFAGNPYLIDVDRLAAEGLLRPEEILAADEEAGWRGDSAGVRSDSGFDESSVDFGALYETRFPLLRKAYRRFCEGEQPRGYQEFLDREQTWLMDYSLFMALRQRFGMACWTEWPEEIRRRDPDSLNWWRTELAEEIGFHCFLQYEFFRQWEDLRRYVREQGIRIIGDVPIYVPLDSADVWAQPEWFQLDEQNRPLAVAGVPPDAFSEDGQLWGNPLYRWEWLRKDGFRWWISRLQAAARLYDVIRIDHFRGLESYWSVPWGEHTARNGRWEKGPGAELIATIRRECPDTEFLAEDLGFLTPEVRQLLKLSEFPGMKVLQFAFSPGGGSDYLPHKYERSCVCCTGTHDNMTLAQWFREASAEEVSFAEEYLGLNPSEGLCRGMIRGGMCSPAELFLAPLQDWLECSGEARMNTPGTLGGGNWRWRLRKDSIPAGLSGEIRTITLRYGR